MNKNIIEEIQKQFDKLLSESEVDSTEEYMKELQQSLGFDFDEVSEEIQLYHLTKNLRIKKNHPDAILPKYAYPTDSGFDLYSIEEVFIEPLGRSLVNTGLIFEFDENLELQIRPKSGLSINLGLTVLNTPGTIDCGYTGEVKVIVFNTNNKPIKIDKGMKIAQGVLCPVINGKYVKITEVSEITDKDRNNKGFGSTGI